MQRTAVIGLGKIGLMHASIVSVLPNATLSCLIDSNPALVGRAKSLIGENVPFYPSLEKALAEQPIDAVLICAPHFAHEPIATLCLERGIHVLSEKPMANSLEAARRMRDLAQSKKQVNAVGYMKLYYPHYQKAQALLKEGAIGKVVSFHASLFLSQVLRPPKGWMYEAGRSGGGVVMTCGCHALALLYRFFGLPQRLLAQGLSIHSSGVEDEARVQLDYGSELKGVFEASWSKPGFPFEQTCINIQGTEGTLIAHDSGLLLRPKGKAPETVMHRSQFDQAIFDFSPDYGGEGYYNEDANFINSCEKKEPALVTFEDGYGIQRLIDAVYRSMNAKAVTFDD